MDSKLAVVVLILMMLPSAAQAYVDPGAGMLVWQGLVAIIGMVVAFARGPREAIKRLIDHFRRK